MHPTFRRCSSESRLSEIALSRISFWARLCTRSSNCNAWLEAPAKMWELYSIFGLIQETHMLRISKGEKYFTHLLRKPRHLEAFFAISKMWLFQRKVCCIVIPSKLSVWDCSTSTFRSVNGVRVSICLRWQHCVFWVLKLGLCKYSKFRTIGDDSGSNSRIRNSNRISKSSNASNLTSRFEGFEGFEGFERIRGFERFERIRKDSKDSRIRMDSKGFERIRKVWSIWKILKIWNIKVAQTIKKIWNFLFWNST